MWIRNCRTLQHASAPARRRRCACTQNMAALLSAKWRHGQHLESMTSYPKSDSINQCVFTWRTILPNFIPIWVETKEPWAFVIDGRPNKNNNNKMSSDMTSVPDTSTNVLWIRNCSAYSEPMTSQSHALGGLAGSKGTLMQQHAGERHVCHLKVWRRIRNPRTILPNFIPIRLERTKPGLLEESRPNKRIRTTATTRWVATWDQFLMQVLYKMSNRQLWNIFKGTKNAFVGRLRRTAQTSWIGREIRNGNREEKTKERTELLQLQCTHFLIRPHISAFYHQVWNPG